MLAAFYTNLTHMVTLKELQKVIAQVSTSVNLKTIRYLQN